MPGVTPSLVLAPWKQFKNLRVTTSQKVVVISIGAGVALLAILAQYLKRRRKVGSSVSSKKKFRSHIFSSPLRNSSPSDDRLSQASSHKSGSPSLRSLNRQPSILSTLSDKLSAAGLPPEALQLTPQQLGVMGMEALEMSIGYWEEALGAYQSKNQEALTLTDQEEAEFTRDLQELLDAAYMVQNKCELLFLDQRSVLFRDGSSRGTLSERFEGYSSAESFVSAQDEIADLREFEEFQDITADIELLPFYKLAMKQFEEHGIPYRCLRTEVLHCSSDVEYLGKLHCVRLAFQWIFLEQKNWDWFAEAGREILINLMMFGDKDPKDMLVAFEEMLAFLHDKDSWVDIETELSSKGVKAMTFYDIVLDYILIDAFEDLESPPSSVTAVVQNRWLSNGFKESALATAVWSVMKAKRRMLTYPNGFMAHFYSISEQLSPLMAWGFLGPDEKLKETCLYFKNQVMDFLKDIFSFQQCRYTSVEDLAEDILKFTKIRVDNIANKLTKPTKQKVVADE